MREIFRIIGTLPLLVALGAFANDSDRLDLLEQEIRDLKIRILKLESTLSNPSPAETLPAAGEGWRSVANWRKLKTGMGPGEVRKILGEPNRLDGGTVATWRYQNGGKITFISDKAHSWEEPDQ